MKLARHDGSDQPEIGSTNELDVFINCPFDDAYAPFFDAIVWTVIRYGYRPRCALEIDNSGQERLAKIMGIIGECRFAIHDISRTALDKKTRLPRFNMPLELGMWLGAERFGGPEQAGKQCLILDKERHRYQKFISDISGHDIRSHDDRINTLISELTKWMRTLPGDDHPGGGQAMIAEYVLFRRILPEIAKQKRLTVDELTFGDYAGIAEEFVVSGNTDDQTAASSKLEIVT
jgi:hypothetical protein